jgi:processive 1,2-diacylglycerol beta-glucosyltransferase
MAPTTSRKHSAKKRIVVFSASFGGGHRSAAEAIVRYYKAHYPRDIDVRMIDFFEEFLPGVNVLAKFAYNQSVQFFPTGYGAFFDLSNRLPTNPIMHELKIGGFARAIEFIEAYEPHAVISTYPVAGGVVSDIKANHDLVSAVTITDFGAHNAWLHPYADLYFVACKEVREDLVVRGIPWDRVVVSGIPVHEKFGTPLERGAVRSELGLSDRLTALLTSAAGSTGDLRDIAAELAAAGIQVAAVTGHNVRLKRRLETLERKVPLVHVYGFTDAMHKMMKASDVLVGKAGGLTVSESLASGLPLINSTPFRGKNCSMWTFS